MTSEQRASDATNGAIQEHPDGATDGSPRQNISADDDLVSDPYAGWTPPALPIGRAFAWRDLMWAGVVAGVLIVLGVPVGFLWAAVAPHATAAQTADGAVYTGFNNEVFIAADGILGGMGVVIGILAAIGAYLWLSRRGPWMPVALLAGGALGSLLASYIGHQVGLSTFNRLVVSGHIGVQFAVPVTVKATGVLLLEPLAAVLVYVVTAGWSKFGDLRRGGDFEIPPEIWAEHSPVGSGASSDSVEPAAQPAAPGRHEAAEASSPPA
jgi:hypothetical protein